MISRSNRFLISSVELYDAMGEKTQIVARVLLAFCLCTFAVLFAISFCWLWHLHYSFKELRESCGVKNAASGPLNKEFAYADYRPLLRTARDAGMGETLDNYLKSISQLQLQSLKATCSSDEKVCIQGPKGDVGEKGSKGVYGKTGPKGDRGDVGRTGIKGEKGEPGTRGSRIAAPVIVNSPSNTVVIEGQTAQLHCKADGFPKPKIIWKKLQSALPLSRFHVSDNGSLSLSNVHSYDAGSYACRAESLFGSATAYATVVVRVPVRFSYVPPKRIFVTPGKTLMLRCSATGYPQPTVTWSRSAGQFPAGSSVANGTLTIKKVTADDLGHYSCSAKNNLNQISYSTALAYRGKVIPIGYGIEVRETTDLILLCKLCSTIGTPFNFTWRKVNDDLPESRTSTTGCSLVVSNTTMNDTGEYECIGHSTTRSSAQTVRELFEVTVIGAPRITSHFEDVTLVHPTSSVELKCTAVGPPDPVVFWTKGSRKFPASNSGTAVITITNAGQDDEGEYRCHATSYLGKDEAATTVYLIEKPKFVRRPSGTVRVAISGSVSIDCTATGQPSPSITWKMPCGQQTSRQAVLGNGTLVISAATVWETGIYECTAHGGGIITSRVHVIVPAIDEGWRMKSDSCGGFKQSQYNSSVRYAVSSSATWSKSKYYYCPSGYHWACTEEGKKIFKNNNNWSGQTMYSGKCGWSGYNYGGVDRRYMKFRDSHSTNAYKHTGNYEEYRMRYTSSTSYFAGAVCIVN